MKRPEGLGMWVAFGGAAEKYKPDALVRRVSDIGVKWLTVRSGQSGAWDGYYSPVRLKALLDECRGAGIGLYSWLYSFPSKRTWDTNHLTQIQNLGLDGLIIDAEIEWTGLGGVTAENYVAQMADAVGHAPLGWRSYHPTWPWKEFAQLKCTMPQMYWTELVHGQYSAAFEKELHAWEVLHAYPSAYAPIGCSYGNESVFAKNAPGRLRVEDLDKFVKRYQDWWCWSFYSVEAAAPLFWEYMESWHKARQSNVHPPITGSPIGEQ